MNGVVVDVIVSSINAAGTSPFAAQEITAEQKVEQSGFARTLGTEDTDHHDFLVLRKLR